MAGAGTDDGTEADEERIHVGETSEGTAADAPAGNDVDLPVVELLTGRGFVTGKSGSGKSNTASVVIEKLLDRGLPAMIVDIDGEYYGLKEEYEILHVGADEECDLVVNEEHAGKLAELALEQNVPIILDVSSFLDESDARDLLTSVARHLFAKEKKLKQPFLLVVEEVHEFIPEGGGLDECGRMLIKAAKRGRKHGLGVVGVSQRPADVKKDFITQCDWLVWHRLTWENDTKVVSRILGREYADAIEGMDDGEAFVLTDWSERVRRVQFQRKRTFDAGATPGLDDFERPELKSVSSDLVQDLEAISEAEERRESRIQELERQVADREDRIEELEAELEEARDLSRMAERFSRAMMEHVSGRAFRQDVAAGTQKELDDWRKRAVRGEHMEATRRPAHPPAADDPNDADDDGTPASPAATDDGASGEPRTETTAPPGWPDDGAADEAQSAEAASEPKGTAGATDPNTDAAETTGADDPSPRDHAADAVDIDAAFEALTGGESASDQPAAAERTDPEAAGSEQSGTTADTGSTTTADAESAQESSASAPAGQSAADATANDMAGAGESVDAADAGVHSETGSGSEADARGDWPAFESDGATDEEVRSTVETAVEGGPGFEREVVRDLKAALRRLDPVTRRMLAHYREHGPCDPVDAHVAAGGDGDRTRAYGRNRRLRQTDLVAHAGRGNYGYRLPAELRDRHDDRLPDEDLAAAVDAVESVFLEDSVSSDQRDATGDAATEQGGAAGGADAGPEETTERDTDGVARAGDDGIITAGESGDEAGSGSSADSGSAPAEEPERTVDADGTAADEDDWGNTMERGGTSGSATSGEEPDAEIPWPEG